MQTSTGSEERIQALLRNANTRLLAHPEARRRLLQVPELAPQRMQAVTQAAGSGLFRSLERH